MTETNDLQLHLYRINVVHKKMTGKRTVVLMQEKE